jgi:hypothetical protein
MFVVQSGNRASTRQTCAASQTPRPGGGQNAASAPAWWGDRTTALLTQGTRRGAWRKNLPRCQAPWCGCAKAGTSQRHLSPEASHEDTFRSRSDSRSDRNFRRTPSLHHEADQVYRSSACPFICVRQSKPPGPPRFRTAESFWPLRLASAPASNLGLGPSFASARLGPSLGLHSAASLAGGPSSSGTSSPAISCNDRPAMPCRSP